MNILDFMISFSLSIFYIFILLFNVNVKYEIYVYDNSYIITTDYNKSICSYNVEKLQLGNSNTYKKIIQNEIGNKWNHGNKYYNEYKIMINKIKIEKIILVGSIKNQKDTYCGFYSNIHNTIVISIVDGCNVIGTLYHEMSHATDYYYQNLCKDCFTEYNNKWNKINIYPYNVNYNNIDLQKGYITKYAMKDIKEDKAELFASLMTIDEKTVLYDEIIMKKIKLMIEILPTLDINLFEILKIKYNSNEYFKNIIDLIHNNKYNIKYILHSFDYDIDENNYMIDFANNGNIEFQNQKEYVKKQYKSWYNKLYSHEPLILEISKKNARIYGYYIGSVIKLPKNIKMNTSIRRVIYTFESNKNLYYFVIINNELKIECTSINGCNLYIYIDITFSIDTFVNKHAHGQLLYYPKVLF
jgi:hypothetical protein